MRRLIATSVVVVLTLLTGHARAAFAETEADAAEKQVLRQQLQQLDAKVKSFGRLAPKLTDEQVEVLHEKAVTHARLGEWPAARKAMDQLIAQKRFDRALVLNAARLDIRPGAGNPVRGANMLAEYMRKSAVEKDAVDLMGMAYQSAIAKGLTINPAKEKEFAAFEAELVSLSGRKRWGSEWVSDKEFASREQRRRQLLGEIDQIRARAKDVRSQLRRAQSDLKRGQNPYRYSEALINDARRRIREAETNIGELRKKYRETWARVPKRVWTAGLDLQDPKALVVVEAMKPEVSAPEEDPPMVEAPEIDIPEPVAVAPPPPQPAPKPTKQATPPPAGGRTSLFDIERDFDDEK